MAKQPQKNLVVSIDIGTSKVVTLVGEVNPQGQIKIVGVGTSPSTGLRKGVVINIEATVQSIQKSVEEAENMAQCQIYSAFTGIAGSHIRCHNSHGIVAIRDREVTQYDVDRVIDAAKAVAIPADKKILHILPQEFIIDNQDSIREPIGMSGVRLEAKVHIVTGAVSAAENILKCLKRCNLMASDIILEQYASSKAILTEDEKDLGVCIVDIGAGTTDIAIFTNGAIRHTAVIPIGGDQVTNDIAIALRTPTRNAEEIKIKHACAMQEATDINMMIDIPTAGNTGSRQISKRTLAEVVESRYEELFDLIKKHIHESGFEELIPAGIVLTGGTSKISYGVELAQRVLKMPVRLGTPQYYVEGPAEIINNPIYATSVGLLLYGLHEQRDHNPEISTRPGMKGLLERMKGWFQGNF